MSLTVQSWKTLRAAGGAPAARELSEVGVAPEGRRGRGWRVAFVVLVVVAVVARFGASLGLDTPWIAPDEMVYAILGRSFWTTGHLELLDGKSGFYGVYPLLAGAPLAAFGPGTGLVVLKALQALLVAVPVVIVYLWTRSMTRGGWALAAAAMTAALPAFVYSGLVMTEVTFLAVVTLLLWCLWRALLDPSRRNQALVLVLTAAAAAIRLKSVILVPSIVLAVGAMAWFVRDARLLRRFLPSAVVVAIGLVLAAAIAATRGSAAFGPYGGALGRRLPPLRGAALDRLPGR